MISLSESGISTSALRLFQNYLFLAFSTSTSKIYPFPDFDISIFPKIFLHEHRPFDLVRVALTNREDTISMRSCCFVPFIRNLAALPPRIRSNLASEGTCGIPNQVYPSQPVGNNVLDVRPERKISLQSRKPWELEHRLSSRMRRYLSVCRMMDL
jgi:hypothetical protein